jgi:hypothetical protein
MAVAAGCLGCAAEPTEETGCCYYVCESTTEGSFEGNGYSAWFGGDDECLGGAERSCALADEESPGVAEHEWVPVTLEEDDSDLHDHCEADPPEWYEAYFEED